ncbi:hypothetical protein K435DRAFT_517934 [Dendrothele bispora CBS 962.96]|uniref:Aminoglycoside phosphotransferase domain-containing protein n=1 Tax=Dendrothele bispora (strain CBS 962.96) TaxID=1314807 RepID=A0A4S8M9L7_DENBC|nr:hypothetical protein K435DRAFT_517934 [Dendrothele bispora CBS 962.96]
MASAQLEMPPVLHCPLRAGRKPTSIPDTTQFAGVTQSLFGVPCATPDEAYRLGAYNELYLLHLDVPEHLRGTIPTKVLARVSRDDKTRSDMSIESEIATMVFVRSRTNIPVPLVYGYCPTRDNAIGQPFSILSFTEGVDMSSSLWENLSIDLKLKSIKDYARIVLELSRLKFDRIGSIYFKKNAIPPNCFELGPVCWCKHEADARRRNCQYNRGPFRTSTSWLGTALDDEIEFMDRLPELAWTTYKSRPEEVSGGRIRRWRLAKDLIPKFRDRIGDVIDDPLDRYSAGPFVLAHLDLNPS